MNFKHKLISFFHGRYGNDALNIALLVSYFAISVLSGFIDGLTFFVAFSIAQLALIAIIIYRMLSRNLYKRRNENIRFMRFFRQLSNRIKQMYTSIRFYNKFLYRTCPKCRARLRMTRKRGKHTVKCPLCGNEFEIKIL